MTAFYRYKLVIKITGKNSYPIFFAEYKPAVKILKDYISHPLSRNRKIIELLIELAHKSGYSQYNFAAFNIFQRNG